MNKILLHENCLLLHSGFSSIFKRFWNLGCRFSGWSINLLVIREAKCVKAAQTTGGNSQIDTYFIAAIYTLQIAIIKQLIIVLHVFVSLYFLLQSAKCLLVNGTNVEQMNSKTPLKLLMTLIQKQLFS